MAQVESAAPTIDFDALLKPIDGENPAGEGLQYSGIYDEIREARRADDPTLSQGQWQTELKTADFRHVINLAVPALSEKSKDLQISVWLCEALTGIHGFVGFRDGLRLIKRLEEEFWEQLFPEIDEGDMEARANAFDWLNSQLSLAIKNVSLTDGEVFTFNNWEESTRFDIPDILDGLEYQEQEKFNALKAQAEKENRKTGEMWRKARRNGNRAFYESMNLSLEECAAELNQLDKVNEEKFDRNQVPSINDLRKVLSDVASVVEKVLAEKRELEPDEVEPEETAAGADGEEGAVKKGPAVGTGAIQSRQDALKRLSDIAEYFRKNEPNSPVSSLIQRAVKWGNMPFEALIQDMVKDDGVVSQVRQTLGFNTASGDSNES